MFFPNSKEKKIFSHRNMGTYKSVLQIRCIGNSHETKTIVSKTKIYKMKQYTKGQYIKHKIHNTMIMIMITS